ncbi:hypothetical protein jhhlp_006190 [Lomentospora prolificans]|uniref:DUF3433 domain-containing protein n=1 Tax=Lomentospora prolificans TaxID=41688 RepID=A0A2N3N593_9PEZI|nr:hypothetical protein jhhlp_006190 [Lomentospora prolificans]
MSWYHDSSQPGSSNPQPPNQPSNHGSFSSRITSFSDIADVSIDHLAFDHGSSTTSYQESHRPSAPAHHVAPHAPRPQNSVPAISTWIPPAPSPYSAPVGTYPASSAPANPQYGYNVVNTPTSANLRPSDSIISLQSQFDGQGRPLQGRESMVSLQSYYDPHHSPQQQHSSSTDSYSHTAYTSPTTPVTSWMGGLQPSNGYQPISPATSLSHSRSRGGRAGGRNGYSLAFTGEHEAIAEEEYDLSLLNSAAPMGRDATRGHLQSPTSPDSPAQDLTSTLGPMGFQDAAFVKKLQEEEAKGHLTGGLGSGLKLEKRILGSDLLRAPTRLQRSLTRRLTARQPQTRSAFLRDLGQDEANRRGEVIELIIDEPTGVDISAMVGPEGIDDSSDDPNKPPPPQKKSATEVFYPQPNWKPFSMRWPYLSALVVLSLGLAVAQEFIYQVSTKEPLIKFTTPDQINPAVYFAIKFLPTIISVTYGVLWQVTDYDVKRLEAFYQLSREKGALAGESINVDYITSKTFLRPFRALRLKHYAVALSSLGSVLAVSLVPTFGAASILLTPNRQDRLADPGLEKSVIINATWSRLLTITLTICALCASLLFYLLQTRRSGIQADVKGIAGLASMAVVCHILMDFKDMDTAKHEDIHQKLKCRRYILRNSALAPYDENPVSSVKQDEDRFQHTHLSENPHPLMLRAAGYVPFVLGVILFLGFVPAVLFTKATVITDHAPWVVTALAVCIKLGWGTLDTDVRMMEPFYILSRRHAPARALTLDYTVMPFGYMPWRAFMNGDKVVCLVGCGSVIAEVLTVLLTSLATVDGRDFLGGIINPGDKHSDDGINSGQETILSFWISLVAAALILVYLAVISTLVYIRRRHPFLPRQPNTIASVLAYIHQSKMLYDFVNTSKLSHAEMDEKLEKLGKTYGLGWFQGRDGQTHCGVDQEELTGKYRHGTKFLDPNKPWETNWEVF